MTHITDEAVELACKAIADRRGYLWPEEFTANEKQLARENIRAGLEAATPSVSPVTVNPLEWSGILPDTNPKRIGHWVVSNYGYRIDCDRITPECVLVGPFKLIRSYFGASLGSFDNIEDAYSAAQSDFEKETLNRLSTQVQEVPAGLSPWRGWDNSNYPWSGAKHQDEVCSAVFRAPWSMEDAATLIGFIDRTWPKEETPKLCQATKLDLNNEKQ